MTLLRPLNFLSALRGDRSGNFAVLTALLAFPLIALAGSSIDIWQAYEAKTRLDQVADSAALAAIATSSRAFANKSVGEAKANWDDEAMTFFTGGKAAAYPKPNVQVTANVERHGLTLSASVTYRTTVQTAFMGLLGISQIPVSGTSTAEFNVGEFYDISVLVDNSPSMGIGATKADVDIMQSKMGCAFACHDLSGTMNNYAKAEALGVKLRIDVVMAALSSLADNIATKMAQKDLYRLALYSMGATAQAAVDKPLTRIQAMTQDFPTFRNATRLVRLMDMPVYNYNRYAVGNINGAINLVNAQIPAPGDGSSVSSPRQVLLLVTDGVNDTITTASQCYGVWQYTRCAEPVDIRECQKLKDRGILVAVLHTTYLPIATNDNYRNWVSPYADRIDSALKECSTPGLYQSVDVSSDIAAGMTDLFSRATNTPRIAM